MKFAKQATYIGYVIEKQICPNQHTRLLQRILGRLKKKGLKLVCRKHFSYNFKIQILLF